MQGSRKHILPVLVMSFWLEQQLSLERAVSFHVPGSRELFLVVEEKRKGWKPVLLKLKKKKINPEESLGYLHTTSFKQEGKRRVFRVWYHFPAKNDGLTFLEDTTCYNIALRLIPLSLWIFGCSKSNTSLNMYYLHTEILSLMTVLFQKTKTTCLHTLDWTV